MNMVSRTAGVVLCVATVGLALAWGVFTERMSAVLVTLIFGLVLLVPRLRQRRWLAAGLLVLVVALPLQPVEIAPFARSYGPKLVQCCPGSPYRNPEDVKAKDAAGICLFCSDLGTGFQATWYLVL